ncbi:hypothetical protein BT63DRAFT_477559 [Microthyrium microscopicum]|uniref:Uncharacterized protein n=1 Tax=Microthyrium microscopicum TaxID=703497 RepID=A0A6A6UGR1_9PEZI|nr:hypothetical protein BT63DRAFT_477559 [Microthyrium microscopicum]
MKITSIFASLVAVQQATAGSLNDVTNKLARRQLGDLMSAFAPPAAKVERLNPLIRKDASRERMWFGPYTLPSVKAFHMTGMPLQMDPSGVQITRPLTGFCSNCTVLYGKANLFFENGTRATASSGVYVHHIVVVDTAKRTFPVYLCDGQKGFLGTFPGVGFIISGNDEAPNWFTTPDGKFNSGYGIKNKPMLAMTSELVNYREEDQKVFIAMEYEYMKGSADTAADASVSMFSVTGCDFPDYHPKTRVYNISSAAVPSPSNGYIINAKGHLHDGGDHIVLTVNGNVVCDSKAIYTKSSGAGGGGHHHKRDTLDAQAPQEDWDVITEMTQCTKPIPVKKGDKLQMVSYYDGEKHPPRPTQDQTGKKLEADEMGVFFLNFAASDKPMEQLVVKSSALIQQ